MTKQEELIMPLYDEFRGVNGKFEYIISLLDKSNFNVNTFTDRELESIKFACNVIIKQHYEANAISGSVIYENIVNKINNYKQSNNQTMTQEELINKAVSNIIDVPLEHITRQSNTGFSHRGLAKAAIKEYIKLKDMEDVAEVNESDIEKVVEEEYTEAKHDCGDKPQTLDEVDKWAKSQYVDIREDIPQDEWASTPKSEVDNLADRLVSSKIRTREEEAKIWEKYFTDKYGGNNWYEALCNKTNTELNVEIKRILQQIKDKELQEDKEKLNEGLNEGLNGSLLSSHQSNNSTNLRHNSKGHLLKVTKKYPHRINQLQLLHNKHKIQQLSEEPLTQGVSILECDIIWNDDVWSDEHIVPYNVAVYECELAKDVDSEVGFQFYSFKDMYDYLEWKPNQDFTIVRIRDYYTTVNK